ncbi:hypothetical protein ACHAW6_003425 [Cyclotella cf. meneghiniana]
MTPRQLHYNGKTTHRNNRSEVNCEKNVKHLEKGALRRVKYRKSAPTPPGVAARARKMRRAGQFLIISSVITVVIASLNILATMRIVGEQEIYTSDTARIMDLPNEADHQHNSAELTWNISNIHALREDRNIIWMYWLQGIEHLMSLGNQTGKYQLDSTCVQGMQRLHRPSKSKWVIKLLDNNNVADYAPKFYSMIKNQSLPYIQNRLWSDLLRLELLSLYGGIWADTSVCPFVPFDQFIAKYLGTEKDSFYAPDVHPSMSYIVGNSLPKDVSTCHLSKNDAIKYRTASTWFMAVSNPHNTLIEEWMRILVHHLTTLPDPNQPYYLSHCSLTQARMYNSTVDNIWRSTLRFKWNTLRKGGRDDICFDSGLLTLDEMKKSCALVKKPNSPNITSFILGDYLKDLR